MAFDSDVLELNIELEKISKHALGLRAKTKILSQNISFDNALIKESLDNIDSLIEINNTFNKIPLIENYDILKLLELIVKGYFLNLDELKNVYKTVLTSIEILNFKKIVKKGLKDNSFFTKNKPSDLSKLKVKLDVYLDKNGIIKDNATEDLYKIRKKIERNEKLYVENINEELKKHRQYLSNNIVYNRGNSLCIAIKDKYKNKVKGNIIDISNTKQTIYIEPSSSSNLRQKKLILIEQEKNEIKLILEKISLLIKLNKSELVELVDMLTFYDIYQAKAVYCNRKYYSRPNFSSKEINLINARHPHLKGKVVPINITLSKESKALFITGSNTGGKTVALKTVGLIQLLGQLGLYIPAEEGSKIMVFENLFADIGDYQSIHQNLSTFSNHLSKQIRFINHSNSKTLILIDEIGSGTDPQEGVSIAKAIMNEYLTKGAMLFVTTHFQAIKEYAITNNLKIASVAFDLESLTPLYEIVEGIFGQSHGLDIAKKLGLQKSILENSKEIFNNNLSKTDKLLIELQKKEKDILNKETKYMIEKQMFNKKIQDFENKRLNFEKKKQSIIEVALKKKTDELDKKIKKVKNYLKELSKKQINFNDYSRIRGKINNLQSKKVKINKTNFEIGDQVKVERYDQVGTIIDKKKNKFKVVLGQFEIYFESKDLVPNNDILKREEKRIKNNTVKRTNHNLNLDLRGYRFEEVKFALEKHIDDLILSNIKEFSVIHGFGTGAVKKAVDEFIKGKDYIKSHRLGKEGEGLAGVTVIELK